MLLANRRHRMLFLALAGMDVAWVLPFIQSWAAYARQARGGAPASPIASAILEPLPLFLLCWSALIVYLFLADWINQLALETPGRELVILTSLIGTSLLAIRLILYAAAPLGDLRWLADTASALFNSTAAFQPPLLILVVNAYLWLRVSIATDRGISFFSVGVTFRLGMLLSLVGGVLLTTVGRQPASTAIVNFALFFAFGLIAVALARIDEKAVGAAGSTGALLPWPKFAQLSASVLLFVSAVLALTKAINPSSLRALVSVFDPLWSALGWVLARVLVAILLLLGPLMERFVRYMQRLASEAEPQPGLELSGSVEFGSVETVVREWAALRYCLVIGAIILVLLVILLFFVRTRPRPRRSEAEQSEPEELTVGRSFERLRFGRVREWLNLVRRHGLGRRLLAAATVQNIYANLSRLARRRGHPRQPAQSPDDYLPALRLAFAGHDEQLLRITLAYMRVHYGDQDITQIELDSLRADYAQVIAKQTPGITASPENSE